jgi:phytoene dehydrogenase-like protein
MHAVHEINHLLKAIGRFNAQVFVALDNDALTEFARTFRGITTEKWLAMRDEFAHEIPVFIATPQEDWWTRWPDRLTRTALALAAWQLSSDLELLLSEIQDSDRLRNPLDPAWMRDLASEAVECGHLI